jgi:hypothetical protein
MDALTVDLIGLRYKVQAARIVKRIERESGMAIDVSGLKAKALKARANWDRLHAAYDKFNELAPEHATEVEGMTSGLGEMQSDLEFATNLMGNSSGGSEKVADTPLEKQVIKPSDVGDVATVLPEVQLGPIDASLAAAIAIDTSVAHITETQTFGSGRHITTARAVPSRRDL